MEFVKIGAEFDLFMLAGRYTLLDTSALNELLPMCEEAGICLTLAGPYNSGILAAGLTDDIGPGSKYLYQDASLEVIDQARRIKTVCDRYRVPMRAAALQFGTAHSAVVSTVPGARSREEALDNSDMIELSIPRSLWEELKAERLIPSEAPFPDKSIS